MVNSARAPKPAFPTYGVFVQFRKTRLRLRRGLPTLDDAIAFSREVRMLRFHKPESVFIMREPDGAVIPDVAAPISAVQPDASDRHAAENGVAPALDDPSSRGAAGSDAAPPISSATATATRYAKAAAAALEVLGPISREQVLGIFQVLGFSASDASASLDFALTHEILFVDAEDPTTIRSSPAEVDLRVPRAPRGDSRRRSREVRHAGTTTRLLGR